MAIGDWAEIISPDFSMQVIDALESVCSTWAEVVSMGPLFRVWVAPECDAAIDDNLNPLLDHDTILSP